MTDKKSIVSKASTTCTDQLIGEFKALMHDAEALIHGTEGHLDGALGTIRSKAAETLADLKEKIEDYEDVITDKAKAVAQDADNFVHRNPWEAVGVAAGLGLLIGIFIRRH
jgi:ElaB/YqjD/DUF883 family membrane-anchored ribosome-binding protein